VSSINSIGITSASFDTGNVQSTLDQQMQPVANLLNMSLSDMRRSMSQGQTLADLAKSKGVSEDDLESTIADGLQQNTPAGGVALSANQAAMLATAIATGKAPTQALNLSNKTLMDYINEDDSTDDDSVTGLLSNSDNTTATSSTSSTNAKSLDSLAKALGVDTATLQNQLQSGDTTSLKAEITAAYGTTAGLQFDAAL
jgi:lambda repressor-like predicted transcriptional regulator